jgi:hypothetical protein
MTLDNTTRRDDMNDSPAVDKMTLWNRCSSGMTPRDRRNIRHFNAWALSWAAAFVAATLGLGLAAGSLGDLAWLAALLPTAVGVVALLAYVRFLRQADELLRRVSMEGLALGFGVGWLFMTGWRLLERAGAPGLDIDDPLMVMVIAWAVGQWLAWRRYS